LEVVILVASDGTKFISDSVFKEWLGV